MDLPQRMEFCTVSTFFCWKFCFSLRTSCKELIWCTNNPTTMAIFILFISVRVSFVHVFSLWVSLPEKKIFAASIRNDLIINVSGFMITAISRNCLSSKILCHWSACKCNDMQTWFSLLCQLDLCAFTTLQTATGSGVLLCCVTLLCLLCKCNDMLTWFSILCQLDLCAFTTLQTATGSGVLLCCVMG